MTGHGTDRYRPLALLVTASLLAALAPASSTAADRPPQRAGMQELSLQVDGLSCPFCAYGLEKKLKGVENVASIDIEMEAGQAVIRPLAGTSVDPAALAAAVREGGFTPRTMTVKARGHLGELDDRPVLSLPGEALLILADDDTTRALVSEAGGADADKLVELEGIVDFDHSSEGHSGHPFTLQVESFEVTAGA